MPVEIEKMTPLPWTSVCQHGTGKFILAHHMTTLALFNNEADCDFAEVARKAWEIMMRREWTLICYPSKAWRANVGERFIPAHLLMDWCLSQSWPDPFTAIVEAEKWCAANGI